MPDDPAPQERDTEQRLRASLDRYWRNNLVTMAVLLCLWAAVSFGCGILFVEELNRFNLFGTGFPLGFWFAQQGSILTFIVIVLTYALLMNRNDRKHHEEREAILGLRGDGEDGGR